MYVVREPSVTVRTGEPLISITIDCTVVSRTENCARVVVDEDWYVPNCGFQGGGRVPPQPSGPHVLLFGVQQVPFARHVDPLEQVHEPPHPLLPQVFGAQLGVHVGGHGPRLPPHPSEPHVALFGVQHVPVDRHTEPLAQPQVPPHPSLPQLPEAQVGVHVPPPVVDAISMVLVPESVESNVTHKVSPASSSVEETCAVAPLTVTRALVAVKLRTTIVGRLY